ncbi:Unconventional myosin-XVI [Branchiostoma belcheri]|nr:Unconventional myosin-XVI [Branchiostoma belcheri]
MDEDEFRTAVERGDVQTVRRGLQAGRDVNQSFPGSSWYGRTALHLASWNGQTGVVELLIQHGANLEARDKNGWTTLHLACRYGHTGIVELLIQHGADMEARTKLGSTALHLASGYGQTGVVELLIQHGADIEARDKYGETALYLACRYGHTGIVELLIQHGADMEGRDTDGQTALHLACRYRHIGVVKLLIQHGADMEAGHEYGRTALRLASEKGQTGVVELLIQHGADVEARDDFGRKPLDYVDDQGYQRFLKNLATEVSYHKLMKQSGGVKVNRVKLCFCGPQEAGKSTLMESLQTGPYAAFFWDQMPSGNRPHEPTPGVNVATINIPGVGEVSVWDFAGQSEYAVTHSMFMDAENTIFIVLYNIMDDIHTQKKKVHWWLCFIKSCNTKTKTKPNIILVASHADQMDTGHEKASSILELMASEFKGHLIISDEVVLLDCRKTRQTDMWRLKDLLTKLKTQLLAHERDIPKLCAEIMKCLPKWTEQKCSPKCPVLKWAEYKEAAMEIDRFIDEDFLKTSSRYLDHLGEILFVPLQNADPIIVLKPNWLCTDVFGKVMAPENFPIQHLRTVDDVITKEEIKRVFKDVADVDLLITLLQEFQLCHTFDGQEFIIPGLLTQIMPPEKWQLVVNPANPVYFGKQVQCADTTDMFSSAFFPRVQTRLMRELKNRPLLWRDGAKCFDINVEGLIKLSPDGRAVNICVRSEQGDKPSCRQMLETMENILTNVLDECSPGTNTEKRVLSARALREHREEIYSYSMDQINTAKAEDGFVYHDILGFTEDVDDLLYGGRDDDEEGQGAVGKTVHQTYNEYVSGTGNLVIRAGDNAHFDMAKIMQGNLGQLQLEGNDPGDLGQLQLEEDVPGDLGQLQLEGNDPGDLGQQQLEGNDLGDLGQQQLEGNDPDDLGQQQLEGNDLGDLGQQHNSRKRMSLVTLDSNSRKGRTPVTLDSNSWKGTTSVTLESYSRKRTSLVTLESYSRKRTSLLTFESSSWKGMSLVTLDSG